MTVHQKNSFLAWAAFHVIQILQALLQARVSLRTVKFEKGLLSSTWNDDPTANGVVVETRDQKPNDFCKASVVPA